MVFKFIKLLPKVENQRMNIMKGMKLDRACKYIVVQMLLNPTITMITVVVLLFVEMM